MSVYISFTATVHIQDPTAEPHDSAIAVAGRFITDSLVKGCFIVLQCNESTPDKYRAIPRNMSEENVFETIHVPSSNYTVYAYDIEGNNGLPYEMPANVPENEQIMITSGCELKITCSCHYVSSLMRNPCNPQYIYRHTHVLRADRCNGCLCMCIHGF